MSLTKTKHPTRSLTIQAAGIAVAASLLPVFGITVAPDALPHLHNLAAGVAAAVAIYGRIRASTLIEQG